MKPLFVLPIAAAIAMQTAFSAVTVEWGSLIPSTIVDSTGTPLDGSFTFQLGFFRNDFTPDPTPIPGNAADWAANWVVFDQAVYNEELGYFTGSAGINADGSSTSPYADNDLGLNYTGEQAYIWVFNSQTPGAGTEWFLASAESWVFPAGNDDCCDPTGPFEWSMSDLDGGNVTPVVGAQTGETGAGAYLVTDSSYELQTFVIVPEPSALVLFAMAACGLVLRRERCGRMHS